MNNEYPVTLATPMGNIEGKMTLNVDGTTLSGSLTAMGKGGEFQNGTIDASGNITLSGEIKSRSMLPAQADKNKGEDTEVPSPPDYSFRQCNSLI